MGSIFSVDNKFFSGLSKIVDAVFVSVLWLIFCIPVFTIGAATTALYGTVHKSILRGHGYLFPTFWNYFKENFKISTKMWIVFMIIYTVLLGDCYIVWAIGQQDQTVKSFIFFFLIMLVFVTIWVIYAFAYVTRFENTAKETLKNSGLMAIANLPSSLIILIVTGILGAVLFFIPILLFIMPVGSMCVYNPVLEKVFRKFMSDEDVAKEVEDDQGIDK